MRALLAALLVGASLLASGCADDCETACGKLDFCGALMTMDVFACVDACDHNDADPAPCATCLDTATCQDVATGDCDQTCTPLAR